MSQGNRTRPVLMLVVLFGLLPILFVCLIFLPVEKRMAADQARLEAALQRNQGLPSIQPLASRERMLLEDPSAPWRTRIPLVATDAQRLAHYHRVITDLQRSLKAQRVTLQGVRSTWNPIQGSYTLPASMGSVSSRVAVEAKPGAGQLQAWVLEAQVDGTPAELFRALEALPGINPLLEPVALRWEMAPPKSRQMIVLRNLVAIP